MPTAYTFCVSQHERKLVMMGLRTNRPRRGRSKKGSDSLFLGRRGVDRPHKCLPGIEDCSPNRNDNLESHNRRLGKNSLRLSCLSQIDGEITPLCMHGQHQTQKASLRLCFSLSSIFAGAPPSQPIRRQNPTSNDSNRVE